MIHLKTKCRPLCFSTDGDTNLNLRMFKPNDFLSVASVCTV